MHGRLFLSTPCEASAAPRCRCAWRPSGARRSACRSSSMAASRRPSRRVGDSQAGSARRPTSSNDHAQVAAAGDHAALPAPQPPPRAHHISARCAISRMTTPRCASSRATARTAAPFLKQRGHHDATASRSTISEGTPRKKFSSDRTSYSWIGRSSVTGDESRVAGRSVPTSRQTCRRSRAPPRSICWRSACTAGARQRAARPSGSISMSGVRADEQQIRLRAR